MTAHTLEPGPGVRVYTGGGGSPRETQGVGGCQRQPGRPKAHPNLLLEPRTPNLKYFKTRHFSYSIEPLESEAKNIKRWGWGRKSVNIPVVQSPSRVQLGNPMDCSTPGLPVPHHLRITINNCY